MKMQLSFFTLNKTCRLKDNFFAGILIFSMIMAGIMMPGKAGAEEAVSGEITVAIGFDCSCFTIQDKLGNILFEFNGNEITQQDIERVTYIGYERYPVGESAFMTDFLEITGTPNMVITCTTAGEFNIGVSRAIRWEYHNYSTIPGTVITISDDGVKATSPTTKLRWEKVETAERYAILLKRRNLGYVIEGGKPFTNTKKTSYTVRREKGKTYQIWAQRKVKGGWRTVKTIEITISDDEVNVDSRPTTKLHWKKSKKAERYAVLEKRTSYSMGGIPFAYTKKTSYKVPDEEGKMYQIRAQRKVKGKWKTIKTINITL